jgi:hypothetical protein
MRVTSLLPVLLFTVAGALPAAATGTLDCVADTGGIEVRVHGVVPYAVGSPLIQVDASVAAELDGIGGDMTNLTFKPDERLQYWLDGDSLNLLFYAERSGDGPFGSSLLVIMTTREGELDEQRYVGTYVIDASDMPAGGSETVQRRVEGSIECFAG